MPSSAPELLIFSCPACDQRLAIPSAVGGTGAVCPFCSHVFHAPELGSAAASGEGVIATNPPATGPARPAHRAASPARIASPGGKIPAPPSAATDFGADRSIALGQFAAANRQSPGSRQRTRRRRRRHSHPGQATGTPGLEFEGERRRPTRKTRQKKRRARLIQTLKVCGILLGVVVVVSVLVRKFVPKSSGQAAVALEGSTPKSLAERLVQMDPQQLFRAQAANTLHAWATNRFGGLTLIPRSAPPGSVPRRVKLRELDAPVPERDEQFFPGLRATAWTWSGDTPDALDLIILVYQDAEGQVTIDEALLQQSATNRLETLATEGVADDLPYLVSLALDPDQPVPAELAGQVALRVGYPLDEQPPGVLFLPATDEIVLELRQAAASGSAHAPTPGRRATLRLAAEGPAGSWQLREWIRWGWPGLDDAAPAADAEPGAVAARRLAPPTP